MICADPERCQVDPTDGLSRWYRCAPLADGQHVIWQRRRKGQARGELASPFSGLNRFRTRKHSPARQPPRCRRMWADPRFSGAAATRWAQLRNDVWSDATVQRMIGDTAALVREAGL